MKILILTHSDIMDKVGGAISVFFSMCDIESAFHNPIFFFKNRSGERMARPTLYEYVDLHTFTP